VDHDRTQVSVALSGATRDSRRRLLAHLAALPVALGLSFFMGPESADANKGKKGKKRGGKKNKKNKNTGGGSSLQDQLGAAADHHSQDMASKNYFSHTLSNGDSPEKNIERFGYTNWSFVGENIAAGQETAKAVMDAWKSSPEHDKNMRDKNFTEIGIGRAYNKSSKYGWYWTTTFGSR
jgi:hypothetical protein